MKKYQSFPPEKFQVLKGKFSIYLNRRVFVMASWIAKDAKFLNVENEYYD